MGTLAAPITQAVFESWLEGQSTGTVQSVECDGENTQDRVVVAFQVHGVGYLAGGDDCELDVGSVVSVSYLTNDPSIATVNAVDGTDLALAAAGLVALLALGESLPWLFRRSAIRRARRRGATVPRPLIRLTDRQRVQSRIGLGLILALALFFVVLAPWALQKAYLTLTTTDSSTMGVVQSRYSGRAGCHSESVTFTVSGQEFRTSRQSCDSIGDFVPVRYRAADPAIATANTTAALVQSDVASDVDPLTIIGMGALSLAYLWLRILAIRSWRRGEASRHGPDY